MKSLSLVLASLLCAASPVVSEETQKPAVEQTVAQVKETPFLVGADAIAMIRLAHENGEFDEFLKEMDDSYNQVKSENGLDSLAKMRLGTPEGYENWEKSYLEFQREKNLELLNTIAQDDTSVLAQKVRSASTEIEWPLALYRQMAPGTGKNSDENALIDLDLEYEYKALHLDKPAAENQTDRREKHYALKMEKMKKMLAASKNFQDEKLKQTIEKSSAQLDTALARNWDIMDLNALAKGRIKPSSPTEEKIASVLTSSQAKYHDLAKQAFESGQNSEAKN